ncbi:hypothetical protein MASR1M32_42130 [Rhodobacter sp.]
MKDISRAAAGDKAAFALDLDTAQGLLQAFMGYGHGAAIGMDDPVGRGHQRDVALPEDQVAALQGCVFGDLLSDGALHVAVAGAGQTGSQKRGLRQARTVDPGGGVAAPDVGRVQEAFGHRHRIGGEGVQRGKVHRRNIALRRDDPFAILPGHGDPGAKVQWHQDGAFC